MKRLLLVLALLCLCLVPAFAQDATGEAEAEPTNQTVDVIGGEGESPSITCEDGSTCVVEGNETPENPVETPSTNVLSISNIISFLIGGIVFAGGILSYFGAQARAAMQDPAKMVLAERLGDSVPVETANKLIDGLTGILEFLKEATDRQPALLKPSSNSNISSTGADFSSTAPRMP